MTQQVREPLADCFIPRETQPDGPPKTSRPLADEHAASIRQLFARSMSTIAANCYGPFFALAEVSQLDAGRSLLLDDRKKAPVLALGGGFRFTRRPLANPQLRSRHGSSARRARTASLPPASGQ